MMRRFFQLLVPNRLRHSIRLRIRSMKPNLKAPRMVWGHMDANDVWQEKTRISNTVYLNHPERVFIKNNVYVGHFSILDGMGNLFIDEGVQLAGWNGIYTHSSHIAIRLYGKHYQEIPEDEKKGFIIKPVTISRYAFIGAGAIILPGVSIGQGALVAAGSIVKNDVEDFQIVSGNPSTLVGTTKNMDMDYLKDPILNSWYEEWQKT